MSRGPKPDYVVYLADRAAPASMQFAAAMIPDGRPGTHWIATGPTPEAAMAKLDSMWEPPPKQRGDRPAPQAQVKEELW